MGENHLESPTRLKVLRDAFSNQSTLSVKWKEARDATQTELETTHSITHIEEIEESQNHQFTEFTPDTIANEFTYEAALSAAGGTIQAALYAFEKKQITFAMLRPPGHHATHSAAMGFCFFNNVAIAANILRTEKNLDKIVILDIDNHHGNGTQSLFYQTPEVLYISLHAHPAFAYPGTGLCTETGDGLGSGFNINIPLTYHIDDKNYLLAIDEIVLPIINIYDPQMMLISLGLDGLQNDPYGALSLSPDGFYEIGNKLTQLNVVKNGRVSVVLEGGYNYEDMGRATVNFFEGIEGVERVISQEESDIDPEFIRILRKVKGIQRGYWIGL